MMYCTFAMLFIAQAYNIELSHQAADHHAAAPDAHLQGHGRRAARLAGGDRRDARQFNIPEAGLLLILGIDKFLDMGRSATNVIGNSIATAVVAKWEGDLIATRRPKARARRRRRRKHRQLRPSSRRRVRSWRRTRFGRPPRSGAAGRRCWCRPGRSDPGRADRHADKGDAQAGASRSAIAKLDALLLSRPAASRSATRSTSASWSWTDR